MITGTTGSWTTGTAAIDDPERQPVFGASIDLYGSVINEVTVGSSYHTLFDSMPSWLTTYGTSPAAAGTAVTASGGTLKVFSGSTSNAAFVVTASTVVPTVPFAVRARWMVPGTDTSMLVFSGYDQAAQPTVGSQGLQPRLWAANGSVTALYNAANLGTHAFTPGTYYTNEVLYDGTKMHYTIYDGTYGTVGYGTRADTVGTWWGGLGDPLTNAFAGTAFFNLLQMQAGTHVAVGNLGSSYVAQLYGSTNAAVGSAQGTANNGTAVIPVLFDLPHYGYLKVFSGTAQTGSLSRYPISGNGTFWGGGLYKYGDVAGSLIDISEDVLQLSGRIELEEGYGGYVPSGAVSGDMDIRLASGSKFSVLNSASPLYGVRVLNRDVNVNAGFQYDGTAQTLRQFSGISAKVEVDSESRETSLYSLDKSELLRRKKISWPIMHNVPSDQVIRSVLAECDLSWLPDADFVCQFNNTTTSEEGIAPYYSEDVGYADGRWGEPNGALTNDTGAALRYLFNKDLFTQGFVTYWVEGSSPQTVIRLYQDETNYLEISGATTLTLFLTKGGATVEKLSCAGATANQWHLVCFTWDTTTNIIKGYIDGVLIDSATIGTDMPSGAVTQVKITAGPEGATGGEVNVDLFRLGHTLLTEETILAIYNAGEEEDSVASIDPGFNTIEWLWIDERNAWNIIKDICEAEGARFYFDASGKAHFENRYHSLQPPHTTSQKTVSYDSDAMGLNVVSDSEAVINKAVVVSNPLVKQGTQIVWAADSLMGIPAPTLSSGSIIGSYGTTEWWLWFNDPCVDVDTSITGTSGTTQSYFRAAAWRPAVVGIPRQYKDATGSVIMAGTAYSKAIRITATNAFRENTFTPIVGDTQWLPRAVFVGSGGADWGTTEPTPFFGVKAAPITSALSGTKIGDRIRKTTEDTASIGSYGEHAVEINNDFIQDPNYAQYVSQWLVMYNRDPRPTVEGVKIMADPRLEIGDRVTLNDASGATGVANDFWVTGLNWDMSPAYTQELKLKFAGASNFFILDDATQGRLDLNVLAF